ncbi:hypothetical protein M231_02693 [Tremella mesenterica]|uniref:Uncharacterized protein n=1 Tax=Tremella mesenterica TaxID=5217 RepID=A0A4Q1BQ63_TREME|nr:hypothetical protein M231_02693 [Tremella mesenterica]
MSELFASVPFDILGDSPLPRKVLYHILERTPDVRTLIQIIPLLPPVLQRHTLIRSLPLVFLLIRQIAKCNAQAVFPIAIDIFFTRIHQSQSKLNAEELDGIYDDVLRAIGRFAHLSELRNEEDTKGSLPPYIVKQVVRVTEHYLIMLDCLPGNSQKKSKMGEKTLKRLFSPRYLSGSVRDVVINHCEERGVDMKEGWYWRCFESSANEGKFRLAKTFLKKIRSGDLDNEFVQEENNGNLLEEQRLIDDTILVRKTQTKEFTSAIGSLLLPSTSIDDQIEDQDTNTSTSEDLPISHSTVGSSMRYDGTNDLFEGSMKNLKSHIPYAWSTLLHRLSRDGRIGQEKLNNVVDVMPEEAKTNHGSASIMWGLIKRGEPEQAMEIFHGLVEQTQHLLEHTQSTLKSEDEEVLSGGCYTNSRHKPPIDRAILAVATQAAYQIEGNLDIAIRLTDMYAVRPRRLSSTSNSDIQIVLDTRNLNVLLRLCVSAGSPSTALRLFHAAYPRWGIWPDHYSLSLILDVCRFPRQHHNDHQNDRQRHSHLNSSDSSGSFEQKDEFRDRLRLLSSSWRLKLADRDLSFEDRGEWEAYEFSGFSRGDTSILLDPPGYTWSGEYGSLSPWEKGREMFREVVLGNWPYLRYIQNPLDSQGTLKTVASFFSNTPSGSSSRPSYDVKPDQLGGQTESREKEMVGTGRGELEMPLKNARYTYMIPNSRCWHSYILLLGYWGRAEEIPLALAWMRYLDVRPLRRTLVVALAYVADMGGQRMYVRGMGWVGDEERLRMWLVDWLDGGSTHSDVSVQGPLNGGESQMLDEENDNELGRYRENMVDKDQGAGQHDQQEEEETVEEEEGEERWSLVPGESEVADWIRHLSERGERMTA